MLKLKSILVIFTLLTVSTGFVAAARAEVKANAGDSEASTEAAASKAVAETLQQNISTLSRCYQIVARAHKGVVVRVSVAFEIAPDGHVPTAKVIKDDHKDGLFESCIVDAFRSWPFPQPPNGSEMRVTYPVLFSSASSVTIPSENSGRPAKKRTRSKAEAARS